MALIDMLPLREDLPFGKRIRGVTDAALEDAGIREQLVHALEEAGMLVFEEVEQTSRLQVQISEVFGPLKDHPVKAIERVDSDTMPGVITIRTDPAACIVEIDGTPLMSWQPWHFDHSYNDELNFAGVLRAQTLAPEGGLTGFADGAQIYRDMNPEVRTKIEDETIIYTLDLHYDHQLWGLPDNFKVLRRKGDYLLEMASKLPRALHPAVWERRPGERIVHMSPYGAKGILGREDAEGAELFGRVWSEIERSMNPYFHEWRGDEMVIWDNTRMLHMACGCDPKYTRIMHRTTIKGDYGLGRWETIGAAVAPPPEMM